MRKSNPDFHHIRSYILMCVVSLTSSTIYRANTGTQAHTQTAKHQLVRSHPADRTGHRLLFYLWRGGEAQLIKSASTYKEASQRSPEPAIRQ